MVQVLHIVHTLDQTCAACSMHANSSPECHMQHVLAHVPHVVCNTCSPWHQSGVQAACNTPTGPALHTGSGTWGPSMSPIWTGPRSTVQASPAQALHTVQAPDWPCAIGSLWGQGQSMLYAEGSAAGWVAQLCGMYPAHRLYLCQP